MLLNFMIAIVVEGFLKVKKELEDDVTEEDFFSDVWAVIKAKVSPHLHLLQSSCEATSGLAHKGCCLLQTRGRVTGRPCCADQGHQEGVAGPCRCHLRAIRTQAS